MILLHLAILFTVYGHGHSQEQTYLVMGPRVWRVGAQETVLVQALGQQENLPVRISVLSYPDKKTKFSFQHLELTKANNFQGLVTLQIKPKDLPQKEGTTQFVYLEAQSKSFTKEERVPVTHRNGFLFIQTDKPVYTPDQSVKVRIYSMDEELRPARRDVSITFKDPDEVKMDVITQQDATGIMSFPDFKIPANPKFGMWRIDAVYGADYTTSAATAFEVKEYVLPRFSVTIIPQQNFISHDTFNDFTITVTANYYYAKKVDQAKVFIRYGLIEGGERRMMSKSIDVLTMSNGEAVFQFNGQRAVQELSYSRLEELDGSHLYIVATVEEISGSQSEEGESSAVKFVISPYTLKLIGTPLYMKPTLPYYVKIQVKDTVDKVVSGIKLTLTGEMVQDGGEVSSLGNQLTQQTDSKGIAVFVVNIPADITALDFKIRTVDNSLQDENQASAAFTANAYKSPTKSYLYINWAREGEVLQVGDYLNVQMVPSSPYLAKLTHYSYLIVSKGKIVKSDTVQRIHESTSQHLNIQITAAMVPSIRLLVYFIITGDTSAEIVADSIWVDVTEKCINNQKVELSTKGGESQPKAEVPLTVLAQTGSIVALSAVDVSIYDVTKRMQRPMDRVLRKIEESDLGCGAGAGKDNVDVFEMVGLTFITNANIRASQKTELTCNEILRSRRSTDLTEEIRRIASQYPEKRLKQCCENGGVAFMEDHQCAAGIERVKKERAQPCVNAFKRCCELIQKKADQLAQKVLGLGRAFIRVVLDLDEPQVRSYFPESWLWEELSISDRQGFKETSLTLPDSLTTWEIQGIGMSDKGLCVADPLKITVSKDLFLDVQLPYSVIRGEQVEIQVTVYNYQNAKVKGCVHVSVGKEICLVSESRLVQPGRPKGCKEEFQREVPRSFRYNVLPLEIGLHPITFTLDVPFNSEKVVKMLRVVPEGVKMEQSIGFTLDPQGLRGVTKRQQDLHYKIPSNVVPKSGISRIFSINGNILGEVIDTVLHEDGVKYLVSIPKGSAEMELARVAPIFYVYHYLETKQQWELLGDNIFTSQLSMKKKLKEGVNSVLSFQNRDHSYSLWRDRDPSTWMTAFALKIFGNVHRYVPIDHMSVCNTLLWLVEKCQDRDGSFLEKSLSQPVKLQGTIPREAAEKTLYLTAYVVIGIQKAFHICSVLQVETALNRAIEYLSKHVANAQTTFTLAVTAYALAISEATLQSKHYSVGKLKGEALSKGVGYPPVYRYWKDTLKKFDDTAPSTETAKMVETTAYALLTILKSADKEYAKPVVRWLKEQQRYGGGFFSTQDTIIALEALTEIAILDEKLSLDMDVKVSYKKSGDFQSYRLTEKQPFSRPVEVPILDDLTVSTKSARGIATGIVRTVYHIMTPPQENCKFDLRIQKKDPSQSIFGDDTSQMFLLEACARYKPQKDEIPTSGQAVMEITLLTGLQADENLLNKLVNRVDQFVTDYSAEDGKVILHFDWISSDDYVCAPLYVRKIFKVAFMSPGIFKVYEFHAPEQECTVFYNPFLDENLVRVCTGDACKCIEGECPKMKSNLNTSTTADQRRNAACKGDTTYAYKVEADKSEEEGEFVKYTVTIVDIFNKGSASVKAKKQVRLIKKKTCSEFTLQNRQQYLIMGKDGLQIRGEREFQYEYPLDSSTWVEWWPESSSCSNLSCGRFLSTLEDFSESILLDGCQP